METIRHAILRVRYVFYMGLESHVLVNPAASLFLVRGPVYMVATDSVALLMAAELVAARLPEATMDQIGMEFFVLEKLEWNTLDSSPCDILYCLIDILSNGKDFLSNHQRKSIASFLSCQLVR